MKSLKFTKQLVVIFICSIGLASCSKSSNPGPKSSAKTLLTFSFQKANNSLTADVAATISGTQVTAKLPAGVSLTGLKASFTASDKATVAVNGTKQVSGATSNDFSSAVTYTVTAEDGSTQDYTVNATSASQVLSIPAVDAQAASFMSTYNLPGLSIAITKGEKLVYAKAYGWADKEDNQKAATSDLYRIASLSKQITSVAIMVLLDQGKIDLQSKVFGTGALLGTTYGTKAYGPHITDITVDQLLHHTSGGWGNSVNDPMFTNPTMTAQQLITWTLDNRPLDNVPGTHYDYSNFGFCILGRVIEKITGKTYADAVQALVMKPAGITDMSIAGNTLADRKPNEVKYYGQSGEDPYIYNVTRMDSHGGWIASASDLARFLVYVDGFPVRPDIISSNALKVMLTPSTANTAYACGWSVNGANYFHQGSLPGCATEQACTSQGYNFVILTNTRSLDANFSSGLDQLFWNALAQNPTWPTADLFK